MRVLMVSDVYFPRVNGVSTSIETFRNTLAEHGVKVRLLAPRYGDEVEQPDVIRVAGRPVPGDPEDRLARWSAMHQAALNAASDCDLIHIQTPFVAHYAGLRAARQWGIPVIATYHTLFEEYIQHYAPFLPGGLLRGFARLLSRRQCNALDALIVPSTAMRDRLNSYGVQRPLHVLPTGIPLERFERGDGAAFRRIHGIAPERPVALFVGRIAHEKNIGFLLDALTEARQQVPDILLLIAGEGPAMNDVRTQAAALGLMSAIRFIGYLDRNTELPACYAAADLFVFASRTETQGLVLIEAMAAGLPVVALSEMGTADILENGLGCFAAPPNPAGFGQLVGHLLANRPAWGHLKAAARDNARLWSDKVMAGRLAECYRAVCHQHHPEIAALYGT